MTSFSRNYRAVRMSSTWMTSTVYIKDLSLDRNTLKQGNVWIRRRKRCEQRLASPVYFLCSGGSVVTSSRSAAASQNIPEQRTRMDYTKPSSPRHRSAHLGPAVCTHSVHMYSHSECAQLQVPNIPISPCQVPSKGMMVTYRANFLVGM